MAPTDSARRIDHRTWAAVASAALWAHAEAIWFFIIPDVLITWYALRDPRRLPLVLLAALGGAAVGGAQLYGLAANDPDGALLLVEAVPAIAPALIDRASAALAATGGPALLLGGVSGVPYKIYAALAPAQGMGLIEFLSWTLAARGLRFALAALVGLAAGLMLRGRPQLATRIWAGAWIVGYTAYFHLMPDQ